MIMDERDRVASRRQRETINRLAKESCEQDSEIARLTAELAEYKITCPKCTYSKHKELQAENERLKRGIELQGQIE
jgi:hypothetical protein